MFQNESLQIVIDPVPGADLLDNCNATNNPSPCIEVIDDEGNFAIVDSALVATTTIVLFSVVENDIHPSNGALEPDCTLERFTPHSNLTGDEDDTLLTVLLSCPQMDSTKVHNINYVMIDPTLMDP